MAPPQTVMLMRRLKKLEAGVCSNLDILSLGFCYPEWMSSCQAVAKSVSHWKAPQHLRFCRVTQKLRWHFHACKLIPRISQQATNTCLHDLDLGAIGFVCCLLPASGTDVGLCTDSIQRNKSGYSTCFIFPPPPAPPPGNLWNEFHCRTRQWLKDAKLSFSWCSRSHYRTGGRTVQDWA